MPKYTEQQLKEMAWETLAAYNLGDQRADMLIGILSQFTQRPPQVIIHELNKFADWEPPK